MSLNEAESAAALYSIGMENFFAFSVEAGFVNACVEFA